MKVLFITLCLCLNSLTVVSSTPAGGIKNSLPMLHLISANQSEIVQNLQSSPSMDVCFLVDLTWSMEPFLHEVKLWIEHLVSELLKVPNNQVEGNFRLSFIGYRDIEDERPFEILPFISNISEFRFYVTVAATDGGGDVAEDVFGALAKVERLDWNSLSQKLLFHFTDAPCHHEKCGGEENHTAPMTKTFKSTMSDFEKKNMNYFFGQISTRTQKMVGWFQEMYGRNISVFDLGFDASSYSANNTQKKTFVTVVDQMKARALSQELNRQTSDSDTSGVPEMQWSNHLFEGDIDLRGLPLRALVDTVNGEPVPDTELNDLIDLDNAVAEKLRLWPNAIIPYAISTRFSERQRGMIALAIESFETTTCLRWLARRGIEKDYVNFEMGPVSPPVCRSSVGRTLGIQDITLSQDCFGDLGVILHEMMHAIGFIHEQSRNDRDDYVSIQWQNLPDKEDDKNFQIYGVDKIDNLDTNYDYSSVMHYSRSIGGIEIVVPLIEVEIGQRRELSDTDIYKINKLYSCLEHDTPVCDNKIDCVKRALQGECILDSAHMLSKCYKYCQLCHRKPTVGAFTSMTREQCYDHFDFVENFDYDENGIFQCGNECLKSTQCARFTLSKMHRRCYLFHAYARCGRSDEDYMSGLVFSREILPSFEEHKGRRCWVDYNNNAFPTTELQGCEAFCALDIDCHHFSFHHPSSMCYLFVENEQQACKDGEGDEWTSGTVKSPNESGGSLGLSEISDTFTSLQSERCYGPLKWLDNFDFTDDGLQKCADECIGYNKCSRFSLSKSLRRCQLFASDARCGYRNNDWVSGILLTRELSLPFDEYQEKRCWTHYNSDALELTKLRGCAALCALDSIFCHHYTFHHLTNLCFLFRENQYHTCIDDQGSEWTTGIIKTNKDVECYDEAMDCFSNHTAVCQARYDYSGTKSKSRDGKACKNWNSDNPNGYEHDVHNWPGNTCMNPDGDSEGAWCYTTTPFKDRDYCFWSCNR